MIIKTSNFFFWNLLKLDKLIINEDSVDLSYYKIEKLDKTYNYTTLVKYFINVQTIVKTLESNNYTFTFLDKNDFLILDGNLYIINDSKTESVCNNYFKITNIIETEYLPPEFKYQIPLFLNRSFCYFSICSIFQELLELPIEKISHTPLYYSIKRGLENESKKRFLLII